MFGRKRATAPQQIVDKNGVLTTRNKLIDDGSNALPERAANAAPKVAVKETPIPPMPRHAQSSSGNNYSDDEIEDIELNYGAIHRSTMQAFEDSTGHYPILNVQFAKGFDRDNLDPSDIYIDINLASKSYGRDGSDTAGIKVNAEGKVRYYSHPVWSDWRESDNPSVAKEFKDTLSTFVEENREALEEFHRIAYTYENRFN